MIIIKDFKSEAEADAIIEDMRQKGAELLEIQKHFDGNHLVFEMPEVPQRDLAAEIDGLKSRIEQLENKGTDPTPSEKPSNWLRRWFKL